MQRIVCISDTHMKHERLHTIPAGNVLIHAGDFSNWGKVAEAEQFIAWIASQPHAHKIVIAGNHDRCLDSDRRGTVEEALASAGVHYLCDSGVELDGIYYYGTPWCPAFELRDGRIEDRSCRGHTAFMLRREELRERWMKIPRCDVLVTHTPASGVLDNGLGCEHLRAAIKSCGAAVHVFGHVHSQHGVMVGMTHRTMPSLEEYESDGSVCEQVGGRVLLNQRGARAGEGDHCETERELLHINACSVGPGWRAFPPIVVEVEPQ